MQILTSTKTLTVMLAVVVGIMIGQHIQRNDYPITQVYEDGSFKGCIHDAPCERDTYGRVDALLFD